MNEGAAAAAETSAAPVAVITGAGRGIGAACARALAAEGFRCGIHYRASAAAAQALAAELPRAFTLQGDITVAAECDALVAQLKRDAGRCDVLVNNAGANVNGLTATMNLQAYESSTALSRAAWYLSKLVLRRFMLRQKSGRIINISSVVGHTGNAGQAPYTMAKAGLDALTKSLAQELAGKNILVNSVAPGFIESDMTAALPPAARDAILQRVPLQRMGAPEEVADAVAWLSTRANYVHGAVLHVNGGMYGG